MSARINKDDYIGKKFNRWTVLGVDEKRTRETQRTHFKCQCECGKIKSIYQYNLLHNKSKSCNCFQKDNPSYITHGMSKTKFYKTWYSMLRRCYDKTQRAYKYYGARGITVCDRWKDSFDNFKADMYDSYNKHAERYGESETTLDRINVNKNYEPSNCRWATGEEQANNKRDNHCISIDGDTKTIAEWADVSGINARAIFKRLVRGWEDRDAVFKPLM